MTDDDEIAERIAEYVRGKGLQYLPKTTGDMLDGAEAYQLAHYGDVRERAAVRRRQKRVRAKVFAALGLADRK